MNARKLPFFISLILVVGLFGCASDKPDRSSQAKPVIQYADVTAFDKDLTSAFSEPLPEVKVEVLAKISPNAIPDRMGRWMTAIDQSGGAIKFIPPAGEATSKSFVSMLAIARTLWSSRDMVSQVQREINYRNAKNYDVDVYLKRDAGGDTVLDQIVFRRNL